MGEDHAVWVALNKRMNGLDNQVGVLTRRAWSLEEKVRYQKKTNTVVWVGLIFLLVLELVRYLG